MDIDELLKPLSDDAPSGDDLEYDPEFGELERTSAGTPEKVLGDIVTPAVPPDWKQVRDLSLKLFERTRDLRVAIHLANAWLNLDGFGGFRDGLRLIHGMSESLWDTVHPQLDEDDGDPTMRCNALRELVNPAMTLTGVLDAPFIAARVAGRYSLRDLKIINGELSRPGDDERPAPRMELIEAAFREVSADDLAATQTQIAECEALVGEIGAVFDGHIDAADSPDLGALGHMLGDISKFLSQQLSRLGIGETAEEEDWDAPAGSTAAAGSGVAISGDIRSSDDVLRMIDKICFYYQQREPSSPVPILLRRAASLVNKSFLDIVADLAPSGVSEAQSFGPADSYQQADATASWTPEPPEEPASDDGESWG